MTPGRVRAPLDGAAAGRSDGGNDGTAGVKGSMLPSYRMNLIGRAAEIDGIQDLLLRPVVGLLTLTGPGGCGKTRLAVDVSSRMRDRFPDGVYFISLAAVDDPGLVAAVIAQELNIREQSARAISRSIVNFLQDKHVLLVLDNFEQVVSAAPIVSELLAGCPFLKVLITSRTPLHLYGEYEFPVRPLPAPEGRDLLLKDQDLMSIAAHYPSVELFVERARAVKPDFMLTPRNGADVARICAQLDGLPLAIELAAARIKLLDPGDMLARLEHPLQLLTYGPSDVSRRHQSLRNAIQWSYALLEESEQQLFHRLAMFEHTFTLDTARLVADRPDSVTIDDLTALVDKSLLQVAVAAGEGEQSGPRFRMLKTIREYAMERLVENGELQDARRAHARYALALAEDAGLKLTQISSNGWLQRLEDAHDDIRAAIVWSCSEEPGSLTALRLTAAIWRFWMFRGYARDLRTWIDRALENSTLLMAGADASFAVARARALAGAGVLAYHEDDFDTTAKELEASAAIFQEHDDRWGLAFCKMYLGFVSSRQNQEDELSLITESVALFRQTGDRWGLAQALNPLGTAYLRRGDFQAARKALDECLTLFQELEDHWGMALATRSMGRYHYRRGEFDEAARLLNESLALLYQVGDRMTMSGVLNMLGEVTQSLHQYDRATGYFAESLAFSREAGTLDNVALALGNLGAQAYRSGDIEQAKTHIQESLQLYQKLGRDDGIAGDLLSLAALARLHGNLGEAALLEDRAKQILDRIGDALTYSEHMRSGYALHAARTIYEDAPGAPWIIAALDLKPVAAYARRSVRTEQPARSKPAFLPAGLTSREVEVLRLVAQGKTNYQIANDLMISLHTVTRHLTHIYNKAGVTNRAEAAAYAFHNGLQAGGTVGQE